MKVVEIVAPRQLEIVERPDPFAWGEFVVIKIDVAPMCSEYKYYRDGDYHRPFGHEAAGVVVDVAQQGKLKVGDRVFGPPRYACGKCELCLAGDFIYCRNTLDVYGLTGNTTGRDTYAQYFLKQDWLLVQIPDDLTLETASMGCCALGPTYTAVKRMEVGPFDTVLITGLGPVGLGGVINATFRGARVIGVEPSPYRAKLARELGAEIVLDPQDPHLRQAILDLTGGEGAGKSIDCSGNAAAQRFMIEALKPRGQAAFVGEGGDFSAHTSKDMLRKGLTLHGCWHYNMADVPGVLHVIRKNSEKLDRLITHKFPMDQVQSAFELQLKGDTGKVLLYPWQ